MAVISLRPDLDQNVDALPLYISGALPNGKPGLAYEGRLQIHNAVGACTVEQIGGDPLPPGGALSVDHGTMEVVVAWPEYSEYVTPLQNPSFESGDLSGWTLTPKGGTATATADTSQKFDGAYSLRWPGGKGLGSEGGIEVEAWNNTIGPCLPGQRVTSHARCMYNPGGHNFGSRYQGLLRFLDGAGIPIGPSVRGKLFKGRGNNGRWNDASATAVGPPGTEGVQMGAWLTGSNAPVWLDTASWDVPSSAGINIETTLCITLRVRDSAGRTALWSGCISIFDMMWNYGWKSIDVNDLSTFPVAYSKTLNRALSVTSSGPRYTDDAETWVSVAGPTSFHNGGPIWAESFNRFLLFKSNSGNAGPIQMSQTGEAGTWAPFNFPTSGYAYMDAPCYAGDLGHVYVFGGNESNRQVNIITSPTSGTINNVPGATGAPHSVYKAWRIDGWFYVATSSDGGNSANRLWRSQDGFTGWEAVGPTVSPSSTYGSMAVGPDGRIVLTGIVAGSVYTSPDGSPGSFTPIPPFSGFTFTPSGVCYVPDLGLFVVISNSQIRFLTSQDGVEFTAREGFPPGNYAPPTWCGPGINQIIACRGGGGAGNGFVVSMIEG